MQDNLVHFYCYLQSMSTEFSQPKCSIKAHWAFPQMRAIYLRNVFYNIRLCYFVSKHYFVFYSKQIGMVLFLSLFKFLSIPFSLSYICTHAQTHTDKLFKHDVCTDDISMYIHLSQHISIEYIWKDTLLILTLISWQNVYVGSDEGEVILYTVIFFNFFPLNLYYFFHLK